MFMWKKKWILYSSGRYSGSMGSPILLKMAGSWPCFSDPTRQNSEAKSFPGQPQKPRHVPCLSPARVRDPCVGLSFFPTHLVPSPPLFPSPQLLPLLSSLYYTLPRNRATQRPEQEPNFSKRSGHGSRLSSAAAGADGFGRSQ